MKTSNRYIQLGCGTNLLPDPWENYDMSVDITKLPLPFPDNCATKIFIEHCLEHVSGPQGFKFLLEAYRVLQPDGTIRICVPELTRLDQKAAVDIIVNHGHQVVFCETNLTQILKAAGYRNIRVTPRDEIDGHWRVIGKDKDDAETLRIEAKK